MPPLLTPARLGVVMALAAVIGWSANTIFSRLLAEQVPPFTLSLLRTVVALVVFAPFTARAFCREWPLFRERFVFYSFLALTGLGFYNALVSLAGQTTTALNMSLLATTTPVFTILLSRLWLKDPLTPRRIFGIIAAISGVAVLITRGNLALLAQFQFHPGDVYMIGASFIFAFYSVGIRFKSTKINNNSLILFTFLVSAAVLLPISAWEIASGMPILLTGQSAGGVIYLGLIASVFCYICWTGAISRIGPANVALIYYTIPIFTGLQAVFILGEPLLWPHFAGGGLIIAGVLAATRR